MAFQIRGGKHGGGITVDASGSYTADMSDLANEVEETITQVKDMIDEYRSYYGGG